MSKYSKYDKALEKARKIWESPTSTIVTKTWIEQIFPELKESKDEKIIKALNMLVEQYSKSYDKCNGIPIKDIITWLEKIKEEKQTNNTEHKFKVGDKIRSKNGVYTDEIIKVYDDGGYKLKELGALDIPEDEWELIDNIKEHDICKTCEDKNGCVTPCCSKLVEKTETTEERKFKIGDKITNGESIYTIDRIYDDAYAVKEHDCIFIPFDKENLWKLVNNKEKENIEDIKPTEEFKEFVRWFVGIIAENYTLIPSDKDINKWSNLILTHAKKVFNGYIKEQYHGKIDNALNDYVCKVYNALHEENGGKLSFARLQHMAIDIAEWQYQQDTQKNKNDEWSEEDNKIFESFLHKLKVCNLLSNKENAWAVKQLKEISAKHWKPTNEQISSIDYIIKEYESAKIQLGKSCATPLYVLRDNLKQLIK